MGLFSEKVRTLCIFFLVVKILLASSLKDMCTNCLCANYEWLSCHMYTTLLSAYWCVCQSFKLRKWLCYFQVVMESIITLQFTSLFDECLTLNAHLMTSGFSPALSLSCINLHLLSVFSILIEVLTSNFDLHISSVFNPKSAYF